MSTRGWAMVNILSVHVLACGTGGAKPNDAADSADAAGSPDAADSATCPSPSAVPLPSCVGSTTVNPNRIGVATVAETSSTNSDGYAFTLYDDGSAEGQVYILSLTRAMSRQACHLPSATPLVVACLDWLAQAGDISQIPTSTCMKSISFGTSTYVCYRGVYSPDLQCVDHVAHPCKDFTYCTSLLGVPAPAYPQQQDGGDQDGLVF